MRLILACISVGMIALPASGQTGQVMEFKELLYGNKDAAHAQAQGY